MQQLFSNMANMAINNAGCIQTRSPRKYVSAYCQYSDSYFTQFACLPCKAFPVQTADFAHSVRVHYCFKCISQCLASVGTFRII